jgi:transcriptional regulator with XRE-family HTH domain
MNKNIFGNIRTIREMKNFTRDFVAGEMDMSTSGYGKIERGEIDITISKLYKLSDIFGVSITDLLFFDASFFFNRDSERKSQHYEKGTNNSEIRLVHVANTNRLENSDLVKENRKINSF